MANEHASLRWSGDALVLADLGSQNGTWVNGHAIRSPTRIQVGDQIGLGGTLFQLIYLPPARMTQAPQPWNVSADRGGVGIEGGLHASHGGLGVGRDVRGDVYAGHAGGENARAAGRDYYEVENQVDLDITGFQRARGIARFLLIVGTLVSLIGFGLFGYPIVKGFVDGAQSFAARDECAEQFPNNFQRRFACEERASRVSFEVVPWIPLGVALFFGGIVLTVVGRMIRHSAPDRTTRRVRDGP